MKTGATQPLDISRLSANHIGMPSESLNAALALLEAHIRIVTCISAAVARDLMGVGTWPSHFGLVGEIAAFRENVRDLRRVEGRVPKVLHELSAEYDRLDQRVGVKQLRNRVQHGNHIVDAPAALRAVVEANDSIVTALTAAIAVHSNGTRLGEITLEPFLRTEMNQLAVPEEWADGIGRYWMFGQGPLDRCELPIAESRLVGIYSPTNLHRRHKVVKSIIEDIVGLGGQNISEEIDRQTATVSWGVPVLHGELQRSDVFKLGVVAEWKDESGHWRPFSHFLMDVLHWETLLARLEALAETALGERLGKGMHLAPSFELAGIVMPGEKQVTATTAKLLERMVDATEVDSGATAVLFIEGTAGAGKSVAMASCALRLTEQSRAAYLEKAVKPAALFVSSEGHLMANIDSAVSRVVDATPGLSSSVVKVLARHGLLILFVDGLDELLGDASYLQAVDSFDSWASNLGGRGAIVASARSSYFASAYLNKDSSSTAAVNSELWRISGLGDEQIQDVWRFTNSGAELDLGALSASALSALRIPFLCFEAAKNFSGDIDSEAAIRASLLVGYLEREAELLRVGGVELVSGEQLREFLTEVAELLLLSGDRSLSDADLRLAASAAGVEEESALNRLRVMCGLSVEHANNKRRFVFGHDFYFDHFHSQAVLACFRSDGATGEDAGVRLLDARSLERWALDPIISEMSPEWCREWISSHFAGGQISRLTRGNLLLDLIDRDEAPSLAIAIAFGDESLSRWSGELQEVDAEVLEVASSTVLRNGRVRCLVLADGATDVVVNETHVDALRVGTQYLVGDEVREFFKDGTATEQPRVRHPVQELLSEMDRRQVKSPVVFAPDLLPTDQRLDWIDTREWTKFITAAKLSGVVDLGPISSRGGRNAYRLKFSPSIIELADRDSDDDRVGTFWSEIDNRS